MDYFPFLHIFTDNRSLKGGHGIRKKRVGATHIAAHIFPASEIPDKY